VLKTPRLVPLSTAEAQDQFLVRFGRLCDSVQKSAD